jgi:hypothetical protein
MKEEIIFKKLDPIPPMDEFHPGGCIRCYVMTKDQVDELFRIPEKRYLQIRFGLPFWDDVLHADCRLIREVEV